MTSKSTDLNLMRPSDQCTMPSAPQGVRVYDTSEFQVAKDYGNKDNSGLDNDFKVQVRKVGPR